MNVLVTGASGFVGSHLVEGLADVGHDVAAMTRDPDRYEGAGRAVYGDVGDADSLAGALADIDVAYYLVHALDDDDFAHRDADAARHFGQAAAEAGVQRIVYLGGLGADDGDLSPHLESRRQVETILAASAVPVTVLRAAVVIGAGGISWEITRQLVKNLPAMVVPKWAETKSQPIALADVIRYLTGVLERPETAGQTYEIGGADVLSYRDMLARAARIIHGRSLPIVVAPLLTPRLSSSWIALVTDVNVTTARNLIESMDTEVVVTDDRIRDVVPFEPMGYEDAVRAAIADRDDGNGEDDTGDDQPADDAPDTDDTDTDERT